MSQIYNGPSGRNAFNPETGNSLSWALATGMCALLVLTGSATVSAEQTPTESVRSAVTEVWHILDNEDLRQPGQSEERRREIEHVLRHRVSCDAMARHSLGIPWMTLDIREQQQFVSLFVQLLRDALANRITEYSSEQVVYVSEQHDGHVATVSTRLIGRKVDTAIGFLLVNLSGDWLVYDAVVDGVSITNNYRAQFANIIRGRSYEGLLERMTQNALILKVFERSDIH